MDRSERRKQKKGQGPSTELIWLRLRLAFRANFSCESFVDRVLTILYTEMSGPEWSAAEMSFEAQWMEKKASRIS